MFCPVCKCEFREGFTRCGSCDVDLVAELRPEREAPAGSAAPAAGCSGPMMDYCGFLTLEDAREAREKLGLHGIRSEIVIRDPVGVPEEVRVGEEYWLRVPLKGFQAASALLGYDTCEEEGSGSAPEECLCPECGNVFAHGEPFCSRCGARFEADL